MLIYQMKPIFFYLTLVYNAVLRKTCKHLFLFEMKLMEIWFWTHFIRFSKSIDHPHTTLLSVFV